MDATPRTEADTPTPENTAAVWEANAPFWDERMAEGNRFHQELVAPTAEKLLALRPGERVLEVACGNGQFARRMADLGATVLATDQVPAMLDAARARTEARPDLAGRVRYALLDAADPAALAAVPGAPFDAVVANMAIMDMIEVAPLYQALPALLAPGGRFVAVLMHPAFNSMGTRLAVEEEDDHGEIRAVHSVRVVAYRTLGPRRGLAILGQPHAQWYFHRTLTDLFAPAFAAGLVLDGLEEAVFTGAPSPDARPIGWEHFTEIPPVLGFRLRVAR